MSKYIVANFDRREYLRTDSFGEESNLEAIVLSGQGVLMALTVLLADGNNRGGGDLRSDAEIIGSWAGNRVAIVDETVTNAEFSEPGMEHVPLQKQLLTMGKDVSAEVSAAILDGEGNYWACASLNPKHKLSLIQQRALDSNAAERLLSAEGRLKPLGTLDELFGIFGVTMGITPLGATKKLQEGLDKMATAFGVVNDWNVIGTRFKTGIKMMQVDPYSRSKDAVEGVVSAHFDLVRRSNGAKHEFVVHLGSSGSTTDAVYREVFPDIQFESAPALTDGITSPEVARLLSNIDLNNTKEA